MKKLINKLFKGFTLVELIIVIAIVVILSVAAFLVVTKWIGKSRDSRRLSDIGTMVRSVTLYKSENGIVPMPSGNITTGTIHTPKGKKPFSYVGKFGSETVNQIDSLQTVPTDPAIEGQLYMYGVSKNKKEFQVAVTLEGDELSKYVNSVLAGRSRSRVDGNYSPRGVIFGGGRATRIPSLLVETEEEGGEKDLGSTDTDFVVDEGDNKPYEIVPEEEGEGDTQDESLALAVGNKNASYSGVNLTGDSVEEIIEGIRDMSGSESDLKDVLQDIIDQSNEDEVGGALSGVQSVEELEEEIDNSIENYEFEGISIGQNNNDGNDNSGNIGNDNGGNDGNNSNGNDGNDGNSDPVCGNGNVEGDEECDDSNTSNGDGCSSICKNENTGSGTEGDPIITNPLLASCEQIKNNGKNEGNGVYEIDPTGGSTDDSFSVYCDMELDGGGWTLAYSTNLRNISGSHRKPRSDANIVTSLDGLSNGVSKKVLSGTPSEMVFACRNSSGVDHKFIVDDQIYINSFWNNIENPISGAGSSSDIVCFNVVDGDSYNCPILSLNSGKYLSATGSLLSNISEGQMMLSYPSLIDIYPDPTDQAIITEIAKSQFNVAFVGGGEVVGNWGLFGTISQLVYVYCGRDGYTIHDGSGYIHNTSESDGIDQKYRIYVK